MFIYADESGHSGRYIFNPPVYYYQGAILSKTDTEPLLNPIAEKYCQELRVERLHANELKPHVVEIIAASFLSLLKEINWTFHLTIIEKPYLAVTKFVDSIFDSYENKGARWLWYNQELFRHTLCLLFNMILITKKKKEFWDAYLKDDYCRIQAIVKWIISKLDTFEHDKRLDEVARDGLNFALKYPEEITLLAGHTKKSYKGHTPNMVAFSSLIHAIHKFCSENNTVPEAFIHDPQSEFGTTMREYHKMFAKVKLVRNTFGFLPQAERTEYDLGKFSLTPSANLASLQAVDAFIWLSQRPNGIKSPHLKQQLLDRTDSYYISEATSELIVYGWLYKLSNAALSEQNIKVAKEQIEKMETTHKSKLKEFETKKIN